MKVFISITLRGVETAVQENVDALIGVLDSTILDTCTFSVTTFSEEELEK